MIEASEDRRIRAITAAISSGAPNLGTDVIIHVVGKEQKTAKMFL